MLFFCRRGDVNLLTAPDFDKKQIVAVFFHEGEKLSLSNSNLTVKDAEGKIKLQCSCYRLFIVFAIGHFSITSAIIQAAKKFGFFIAVMNSGFRLQSIIGAEKDSNYLLHKKQYDYEDIGLAVHILKNKMSNQATVINSMRHKSEAASEAVKKIMEYSSQLDGCVSLNELMAYEGLASKLYFSSYFNTFLWQGRQPRIKRDYVNSALDVGYTLLFTFIDTLLSSYGFDNYCGVMHRQFYKRKSFVCDIIEPFRPIIDKQLKKGINLKQIKQDDFILVNGQYKLQWKESSKYVQLFMTAILDHKQSIFKYIQSYYRAFMKGLPSGDFPVFDISED